MCKAILMMKGVYALIEESHKVDQNFIVSLIKEIAEELRYQVHTASEDNYLKYWLMRRFSGGITFYFATNIKMGLLDPHKDLRYLTFDKLKEYQLANLKSMVEILDTVHANTKGEYNYYLRSNFELPIYY